MDDKLTQQGRRVATASEDDHSDFLELLRLVNAHYDRIEATISQSVNTQLLTQARSPVDAIFDSVTEALLSVDAAGNIRVCNKVCSRYFRLEQNQIIGASLARLLPDAAGVPVGEFLEPFMSDLDDTHVDYQGGEIEVVRANGERFFAEINASTLETPDGIVYVISLRDITMRRDAEHALKENEERYRALVEFAPEAIIVFDVDDNKFIDVNDKACQLFNLSRTRLLTIGPEAISPKMQPDGTPSFGIRRGLVDRALRGEHPIFEWMHKDSTGREFPCEVRFSRMPSSSRQLLRVSITNIEDRKRNEMLTFAQNKILEMIASSSPCDQTLRAICRFVERISNGLRAAVMVLDPDAN
jgi:PAS domain S-box-containing protein